MGLDSVELLIEIEKYFGIEIPDAEAEKISTVQEMVDAVSSKKGISAETNDLQQEIFQKTKDHLTSLKIIKKEITLQDKLVEIIPANLPEICCTLETALGLKVPGPEKIVSQNNTLLSKLLNPASWTVNYKAEELNFKNFADAICFTNYLLLIKPGLLKNKYDIYVAVAGITIEKMGVDPYEIAPEKSFTSDLGID